MTGAGLRCALALGLALGPALPAPAQAIGEVPRMLGATAGIRGYDDLPPDRFGTPAAPRPDALGVVLLLRMFRNTCLGLEAGRPLAAAMPPGFSAHGSGAYLFGQPGSADTTIYLSSTGDVARDEDEGHPAIALRGGAEGVTCRIEWRMPAPLDTVGQEAVAHLLGEHFPYLFALVRYSRPVPDALAGPGTLIEWDRPCRGAWCPTSVIHALSDGQIVLTTRLNIEGVPRLTP